MSYYGWQFLQESDNRFNLIAPIFQNFTGEACPQTPLGGEHTLHALSVLSTLFECPTMPTHSDIMSGQNP